MFNIKLRGTNGQKLSEYYDWVSRVVLLKNVCWCCDYTHRKSQTIITYCKLFSLYSLISV